MANATQSTAPATIIAAIKARLVAATGLDAAYVQVIVDPNPTETPYTAEKNVALKISSPQPQATSGAGRFGYQISRIVEVWITTENLLDVAGSDERALTEHLGVQDTIVNALLEDGQNTPFGGVRGSRLVAGGQAPTRTKSEDAGLIISSLNFEIIYIPVVTVRST